MIPMSEQINANAKPTLTSRAEYNAQRFLKMRIRQICDESELGFFMTPQVAEWSKNYAWTVGRYGNSVIMVAQFGSHAQAERALMGILASGKLVKEGL